MMPAMRKLWTAILALMLPAIMGAAALAQVINAATTNGSVLIATGNTFQTVLAALGAPPAQRRSLTIQNNNASGNCYVFVGATTASTPISILLLPGGSYARYYPYVPSDAIQGTCATTGASLYVDTQ